MLPPLALRVAATLAVLAVVAVPAAPSFEGWFNDDDFQNMRWVLEYQRRPWVALTQLHVMHDHVRPLGLLAQWAGAQLSNGAWWGPHAVLVAFVASTALATARIAHHLTGRLLAGIAAGALTVGLAGTKYTLLWNAWISTTGETSTGLWAVAAALVAVARSSRPFAVLALVLAVAAGLFKEPGWFTYPAALGALAWTSWRAGIATPASRLLALSPVLAVLGFATTWNTANLARVQLGGGMLATVLDSLQWHGVANIGARSLDGIPLPLVAFALAGGLVRERDGRPDGGHWLALGGLVTVAGYAAPEWVGAMALTLALATLARRWQSPPVALVIFVVGLGVMLPKPGPDAPHTVSAGCGLAIWVVQQAAVAARAFAAGAWSGRRTGAALLGGAALLAGGSLAVVLARAGPSKGDRAAEASLLALTTFVRAAEVKRARDVGGMGFPITPLFGSDLGARSQTSADEVVVLVGADAVLNVPKAPLQALLAGHKVRLGSKGATVEVEPGWYAGVVSGWPAAALSLRDACGHTVTTGQPRQNASDASIAVALLEVGSGCGPVTLEGTGGPQGAWLAPLPPPAAYDLRSAKVAERVIRVTPAGSPPGSMR